MARLKRLGETQAKYSTAAIPRETLRKLRILSVAYGIHNNEFLKILIDAVWNKEMNTVIPPTPNRLPGIPRESSTQAKIAREAKDAIREFAKTLD